MKLKCISFVSSVQADHNIPIVSYLKLELENRLQIYVRFGDDISDIAHFTLLRKFVKKDLVWQAVSLIDHKLQTLFFTVPINTEIFQR